MTYTRKEVIGDCVLYQGDCLEVMESLGPVDAVVTDPPYGMNFQSNHRKEKHNKIRNDGNIDALSWSCEVPVTHSKYIWMRWDNLFEVPKPRSLITWVKNNHSMGDLDGEHGRKTEVCAFYRGENHFFPNDRPTDVVFAARTGNNNHPTEKPVPLMITVIGWTSGTILDPFMGSGTTLVACAKLGRKGIGIELDESYFEISCRRVEEAYRQPDLFIQSPKSDEPVQERLFYE